MALGGLRNCDDSPFVDMAGPLDCTASAELCEFGTKAGRGIFDVEFDSFGTVDNLECLSCTLRCFSILPP
jgi:hypothetical protein